MKRKIRVAVETLGCKLNQAESELVQRKLLSAGYQVVSQDSPADVYILNTCTVTRTADRKARQSLRAYKKKNPDALIVATGCYAERASEELSRIDGVKHVLGNEDKLKIVDLLNNSPGTATLPRIAEEATELPFRVNPVSSTGQALQGEPSSLRTRSFIKIQDGCTTFCAYCIVPFVRGKEESLPADAIISQIKGLVADGYNEVVLTGTEIGSYNYDGIKLKDLIQQVLNETNVVRLRLSSLQPQEITPDFISLWKDSFRFGVRVNPRLCRHFHLSLQSGSDSILKRMKRKYSVNDYRKAVSLIRSEIPDVAITTDVIVGFPGETDKEFEESYNFCREIGFLKIHVFQYSKRPGTLAEKMPEQVADRVKKERSQKMLALSKESARSFIQKFIGRKMTVLWEQPEGEGVWSGLTDNYIRVYTRSDDDLTNRLTEVTLTKVYKDGGWGEKMER